jgi:hypothetical protein
VYDSIEVLLREQRNADENNEEKEADYIEERVNCVQIFLEETLIIME